MSNDLIDELIKIDNEHDILMPTKLPEYSLYLMQQELIKLAKKYGPEWTQRAIDSRQEQIFKEEERILKCL
jgi:hypothetical protein